MDTNFGSNTPKSSSNLSNSSGPSLKEIELTKRLLQFEEVIKMTQNLNSELQKKNENLEIENRTLEEDYHTMKDNYESLKKRFEQLQKEISDIRTQTNKKSSMLGWIMNSGVKEENAELKERIHVLESELNLKIQENEETHIRIFEETQNFNKRISELESEIGKMKLIINDKVSELNAANEKNSALVNVQRSLEMNLNNISENLKKTENELQNRLIKWKNKKIQFKKEIEVKGVLVKNLIPVNEYKNCSINIYNLEYINSSLFLKEKFNPSIKFFSNLLSNFVYTLTPIDNFLELLIEKFNYIYTNIDLKTEHRGYLFTCDKLRFHTFTLQQIFRTAFLFGKIIGKKLEILLCSGEMIDSGTLENILLNYNIFLTLLNKACKYIELLSKYYKIMLKEERKISYNEFIDGSEKGKVKINKELKHSITILTANVNLMIKKLNLLSSYNLDYNFKNIKIISDNASGLFIRVNKDYFKNYRYETSLKQSHKYSLMESLIKSDFNNLKKNLSEFIKNLIIKIEIDYKIFEIIKEETKNKYNYPIINLSAFKMNNDNLKKNLNILNDIIIKMGGSLTITQDSCVYAVKSWEFNNLNSSNSLNNLNTTDSLFMINLFSIFDESLKLKKFTENLVKTYSESEPGVNYEEAIRNKTILREMLEKENILSRDRENYMNKINEYEEDLKRYRDKLNEEKNLNDLLKMQLMNKKVDSNFNSNLISTASNLTTNAPNSPHNEFEDFLKHQVNISELPFEVLSDDVQSGKQRSTFKLSNPLSEKAIPLTRFTAQIENGQDVSVLYHRKILEKIQRHASKIKNTDLKVLSNIHLDEIKSEYENKISEVENKFKEEISLLNQIVKQKDDNIFGYTQTIQFLNSSFTDLEELKDNIKDCQKCKKFIKS